MSQRLRKVVFPVAGLGTRFLPASKVVAKEMLPVLDKPLIQYAVDEAIDAGADTLIFVTNRYKHSIADYFDVAYELEQKLERAGKKPGSEIPIMYTGLRAGEKLFEELFHPLENYSATAHAKIFLAQHREVSWELLQALLHKAAEAADVFDEEELRRCVSSLLPSFRWSESAQPDNVVSIRRANPEINE